MKSLKSGELASEAQVNSETLRYYEKEGLLPEPKRSDAGYRLYQAEDIKRVHFIKRAQDLGFSLKEIKELLALKVDESQSAAAVKALAKQKIEAIEQKITDLMSMKQVLSELYEDCSGGVSVAHCPIIQCLDQPNKKGGHRHE